MSEEADLQKQLIMANHTHPWWYKMGPLRSSAQGFTPREPPPARDPRPLPPSPPSPLPAREGDAQQADPRGDGPRHPEPLQVVVDVALGAGHAGVHAAGALEGAGRPQVREPRSAVLLQQGH